MGIRILDRILGLLASFQGFWSQLDQKTWDFLPKIELKLSKIRPFFQKKYDYLEVKLFVFRKNTPLDVFFGVESDFRG